MTKGRSILLRLGAGLALLSLLLAVVASTNVGLAGAEDIPQRPLIKGDSGQGGGGGIR